MTLRNSLWPRKSIHPHFLHVGVDMDSIVAVLGASDVRRAFLPAAAVSEVVAPAAAAPPAAATPVLDFLAAAPFAPPLRPAPPSLPAGCPRFLTISTCTTLLRKRSERTSS
jgi:hypothetical protein